MQEPINANDQALSPVSLKELITLLIKDKNLHEGKFDLSVEFQIAVGGVGPAPELIVPGAMIGVSRVGLAIAPLDGPNTVDAAIVNPIKTSVKKRAASDKK